MNKQSTLDKAIAVSQVVWGHSEREIAFFKLLVSLAVWLLHYLTLPAEAVLRRRFGLRYFPIRAALAFAVAAWYAAGLATVPGKVCLLGVVLLCNWHAWEAWLWEYRRLPWRHTYLLGTPWGGGQLGFWQYLRLLRLPVTPHLVHRLYEPLLLFVVGQVVSRFDSLVGFLFVGSAVLLAIKMQLILSQQTEMIRDAQDARAFSQFLALLVFAEMKRNARG